MGFHNRKQGEWPKELDMGGEVSVKELKTMASRYEEEKAAAPRALVQQFDTGATRSADVGKADYEGFLSFPAVEEFGEYMNRHRVQPDGSVRDSDNWQKGIPITSYVKSLLRHAIELWGLHRGIVSQRLRKEYPLADIPFLKRETACACFFNVQGFLHETLRANRELSEQLLGMQNQMGAAGLTAAAGGNSPTYLFGLGGAKRGL